MALLGPRSDISAAMEETANIQDATTPLSLSAFLEALDGYGRRVPLRTLEALLRRLDIRFADVKPFARFNNDRYQRNLMRSGRGYHALVLCWKSGQRSPIHDHRGSSCGVRIVKGEMTETIFEFSRNGLIYPTSTTVLKEGAVCGSEDKDIHQVSNLQGDDAELVTLHIYSPPLMVMGTYSLTDEMVDDFADPVFEFCDGDGI